MEILTIFQHTKLCCNISKSCEDISLITTNVNLMLAQGESHRLDKVIIRILHLGTMNVCHGLPSIVKFSQNISVHTKDCHYHEDMPYG